MLKVEGDRWREKVRLFEADGERQQDRKRKRDY